jgi:hypothetical protein
MKCQHGVLRDDRDSTLRLRAMPNEVKLTWEEYLPPLALIALIAVLLVASYLGTAG